MSERVSERALEKRLSARIHRKTLMCGHVWDTRLQKHLVVVLWPPKGRLKIMPNFEIEEKKVP
jgi:hypothetical protein